MQASFTKNIEDPIKYYIITPGIMIHWIKIEFQWISDAKNNDFGKK